MRVVIFGGTGMLGTEIDRQAVLGGHEVSAIGRYACNYLSVPSIRETIDGFDPEVIINCAGAIPGTTDTLSLIKVNALFPHLLASATDRKIIHISTDCVFSGLSAYKHKTNDIPGAADYYGQSKALGEGKYNHVTNIRTSFIGLKHGFIKWLMSHEGSTINGWKNALWTGSTVEAVASSLLGCLGRTDMGSIEHLATECSISKYDLALLLVNHFKLNVEVVPTYSPYINRALVPTIHLETVENAIEHYSSDPSGATPSEHTVA